MHLLKTKRLYVSMALLIVFLVAVWQVVPAIMSHKAQATLYRKTNATTPIKHIVIVMMENHSFDNMFGLFPGVNGFVEHPASNPIYEDFDHSGGATKAAINGGKMDKFPLRSYVQYTGSDLPVSWAYAKQFGLSDNFFSSASTSSAPNHMEMVAAQTGGLDVTNSQNGCKSTQNTQVHSKDAQTGSEYWAYPCYSISSLPQVLDANKISWRYYASTPVWNSPLLLNSVAKSTSDVPNSAQFITDVQSGNMAQVSWITPPGGDATGHPPVPMQGGENFIAQQVNAVMNSQYWKDTAIFVSWDEWGGFYDHVTPPQPDHVGLGLRVPLLVISPYAKAGYISHTQGEFSSFIKFTEENFNLPSLGQRDALPSTSDLMDFFDFSQIPQPPMTVPLLNYIQPLRVPTYGTGAPITSVRSSLTPDIGGPATTFKYDIYYTLPITPTVHNVNIDGVSYPMKSIGQLKNKNVVYEYTTPLGVGKHNFSFTFSTDTTGSTFTLPYNGVPFSGPEVDPFNLTGLSVNPAVALPSTPIKYSAMYQSPTNTAPTLAKVDIDGIGYDLQPNGTNYSKGVKYSYTTNLTVGHHYFRFRFDDGSGVRIYEGYENPTVAPLILTNESVNPTSGNATTVFTFQETYTDSTGQAPITSDVYVDNVAYPMTYVSGSYSTGALYQVSTKLPVGNHSFAFVFGDSNSNWADPFYPVFYAGPNVGANAQAVPQGTLIYPSHDSNPDISTQGDTGDADG